VKKPFGDENIETVGVWSDIAKTPAIITKSYFDDKESWGNIVVCDIPFFLLIFSY